MVRKRMRKLDYISDELEKPAIFGNENASITLVSWGSTKYIVREAINILQNEGISANQLHIRHISPFHTKEVKEILKQAKEVMSVEQNYTGQMNDFIRMKTGICIEHHVHRWDGEPIVPSQIVSKVKEVLKIE